MQEKRKRGFRLYGLLAVVVAIAASGSFQAKEESALRWAESLEKALAQAKSSGKPVFVDVYADWCGWCKKLEQEVFPQSKVAQLLNERYIPVRVDTDHDPGFAQKYDISGLPTLLILEADGSEAGRITGYMEAEPFAERLEAILKGREEIGRLEEAVRSDPDSAAAHYALGMKAWDMDHFDKTVRHLGRALELDEELKTIDGEQALFALAQAYGVTGDYARGEKTMERFLRLYPQSEQLYPARFVYGAMLYKQGKTAQAKASLQLVAEAPEGWVAEPLRAQAERVLRLLEPASSE